MCVDKGLFSRYVSRRASHVSCWYRTWPAEMEPKGKPDGNVRRNERCFVDSFVCVVRFYLVMLWGSLRRRLSRRTRKIHSCCWAWFVVLGIGFILHGIKVAFTL